MIHDRNFSIRKKLFNKVRPVLKFVYHIVLHVYHAMSFYQYLFRSSRLKYSELEIGSGSSKKDKWLHIDYRFGSDIPFDIRKPLPVPLNHYRKVYAEHVLEHFSHKELNRVLRNVRSVLKPGGYFLISVPDLDKYVSCYLNKSFDQKLIQYKPAIASQEPADVLNYIFYMNGEHKHMFNIDSIKYHLKRAGFRNISKRNFDKNLDSHGRVNDSLLVTCQK
tara:strand:- start:52 stop:711 length:660 start_codon:yes stop_codon:yes gene_type:complete